MDKDTLSEAEEEKKYKIQYIQITLAGIITAGIEAMVGYIVLWLFEPIWKKIAKNIRKDEDESSKTD